MNFSKRLVFLMGRLACAKPTKTSCRIYRFYFTELNCRNEQDHIINCMETTRKQIRKVWWRAAKISDKFAKDVDLVDKTLHPNISLGFIELEKKSQKKKIHLVFSVLSNTKCLLSNLSNSNREDSNLISDLS